MRKLALLFCLIVLCACARQPSAPRLDEAGASEALEKQQQQLEARWQKFLTTAAAAKAAPYRLQLSMRFGEKGDTRRVTALFWGNSGRELRLDVMAGVGATVARILEQGEHFLVYSPTENKAYFYQGAARPLIKVGVPVPFTLGHLADLLNGRYAAVFGREYIRGTEARSDSRTAAAQLSFYLGSEDTAGDGALGGLLTLDAAGLPVHWQEKENSSTGWQMEFSYNEDHPTLPSRLKLTHHNGKQAIVLIKDRNHNLPPFSEEQLSLPLPPTVPILPLSQYKGQ